ncbi:MAG: competence/damage-inducible protein A [Bacteroidales bacterium]|jgi:nicotinamide-nucleotide amidase|nr:competence/damage-inducible protein A [Bacteroidales bacterium]
MNVSIINIGDELLIGQVVNSNAASMSKMLIAAGMEVKEVAVVADRADAIRSALERLMATSDAVLITGGLGPTKDDVTKQVLCDHFHSELVENSEALANVTRLFALRGYELTPINRQQAWVPRCCKVINNTLGTAPCMWFEQDGKVVVAMPGVPFEMEHLMRTEVIGRLQAHFHTSYILNKNILVQGIGESFLSDLIEEWELGLPQSMRLAYLPQAGMVKLRITARGEDREALSSDIMREVKKLYLIAGQYIVGEDMESLPEAVAQMMRFNNMTLSTAESCTGGTIASKLTALAGASQYFKGGVVAYSNEVKECALGVPHPTLEQHGAVSEETVRAMAEGVRQRLASDYSIATSGIAGPGGGTDDKPVGTVWIAVAGPSRTETRLKHFGDDRLRTIERTCNEAFSMLIGMMKGE